jgi:ADP-ribose pyrophosphatase YjhB (NUDIX family)
MTLEDRTREAVRDELQHLVDTYGDVPVQRETVTNEPDFFERGRELAEEGWLGDAGAWVTDDDGRVLFIRHSGAPETWGTPGGGHVAGEHLDETAVRAVREQTGIDCSPTGSYYARWKTIVHAGDPDRRLHMLTVEFEAGYEDGTVAAEGDGILEADWFDEPPEPLRRIPRRRVDGELDD